MLATQDQSFARFVVAHNQARPVIGQWPSRAGAAQCRGPKVEGEAAADTDRWSREVDALPAVRAESAGAIDRNATGQAARWKNRIEGERRQSTEAATKGVEPRHEGSVRFSWQGVNRSWSTVSLGQLCLLVNWLECHSGLFRCRPLGHIAAMSEALNIFDRRLLRRRRDRAAVGLKQHDFLIREVAERVADRLEDVRRNFPKALDLGCHHGVLARLLGRRGGVEWLVQCDLSPAMARAAVADGRPALAADEEWLPFAPGCFDLIISVLSLHWTNDLPGALIQICKTLKADGLFLGAMLGGQTLQELRMALMQAEMVEEQGASPRVSPFADLRDTGALLQRAGFALPVVDRDIITLTYPGAFELMAALRAMGESNATHARRRTPTRRATLMRTAEIYQEMFATGREGLPVTFEILYMTAWAPHESQPRALTPGSAVSRLADALDSEAHPAGDKARPR
jgi:SAM-dependent methyltransferase